MKLTIEIDTEKDSEGMAERMLNADKAWCALDEIRRELRNIWKYEDLEGVKAEDAVDRIYELVGGIINDTGIDEVW